jgi:hypothetical protein
MPLSVAVPYNLGSGTMHSLIGGAIAAGAPAANHIVLDFGRVGFVESLGVVILSNLVEWLRNRGVTVDYANCDVARPPISYLDDIGFFEAYWGTSLSPHAKLRETTFPFRRLKCQDSHQWIDGNIFPWLEDRLGVNASALYEFKTAVREIFNNIADHSEENVGCMHVQWHPKIHRVKIAVSDFGIGIPTEVRRVTAVTTDAAALVKATKEGFSSKPGKNKGAGLSYLIDNVVRGNEGWVGIYSGLGFVTFSHGTSFESAGLLKGVYPGTLINMILRTDTLVAGDEELDELQW